MAEDQRLEQLRHSCAHLMAAGILRLWPTAQLSLGPAIENGFYYDVKFEQPINEEDLVHLEAEMHDIAPSWQGFAREEITVEQARQLFAGNPFKLELIEEIAARGEPITLYRSGDFVDLCRGGHVVNPAHDLQFFKLLNIAGAYWRGDEKNPMLTRIYGTAFYSQAELDAYLQKLEEARKRDHRKLGKELDLFTFSDLVGSGLPLYTPKGALIRRLLNQYVEELQSAEGYQQVWTPQIARAELFKTSGHYDKYHEDMFHVVSNYSDDEMYLKPMNCPQHTQIFDSRGRSYRELPLRFTDFAMLYRDEKPGELNGLARVRSFSQDDCHIFCTEEQVDAEIDRALQMTKQIMDTFGFAYRYRLSTRDPQHPEKYLGDPAVWDKVEAWAVQIMERNHIEYYPGPGEAAFYAPKMDLMATDALGREWQLSTVQIDFVMPQRFQLHYTDKDGQMKHPVMIHRAILGSTERMIMVLLEHFAGALPVWLSPVQVAIIPISQDQSAYAEQIRQQLSQAGMRSENWDEAESMQNRIRKAQQQKIPYMLIVGKREAAENTVSLRKRNEQASVVMSVADFTNLAVEKSRSRTAQL
jgi:threonyl-tRNA synthetase